jgi:6-pyruvoyltetrahydropterin/6-carboxytetrahydropterin synthase
MSVPTITRKFEFDAAHRVLGHESKCKHLHGHRYVAEVTVSAQKLDVLDRVIDFSVVKQIIGAWIDVGWDHNILLHPLDPLLTLFNDPEAQGFMEDDIFAGKKPYQFLNGNPTAENIAKELALVSQALLASKGINVVHVRIYETPNCWADYTPGEESLTRPD